MLPLQVLDGQRDALLAVGSQAAALRRGGGAGRRRQRAAAQPQGRGGETFHTGGAQIQSSGKQMSQYLFILLLTA